MNASEHAAWSETLYALLARASTDLPTDVEQALAAGLASEAPGSNAAAALATILDNIALARQLRRPLCQDTGSLLFWVEAPKGLSQREFTQCAQSAIVRATQAGILRQNCVDALTGANSGNNLGLGSPNIHWQEGTAAVARVALMLKGGGCENVGAQYALPHAGLAAGRDLEGVRRCVLDAVFQAQGRGCAPGILGVCIGGDRGSGYAESKRQILRPLDRRNPHPELAELEDRLLREANSLEIGPMGFGGKTAVLGVKIGCLHRLPASYFVSVSYMCWACRRYQATIAPTGEFLAWE